MPARFRTAATTALVLVAAGLLTACGAADPDAATTTDQDTARTTTSRVRTDELGRAGAVFEPEGVRDCLEKARTSLGVVMITPDPYAGGLKAPEGILEFWLLQTDYGLPGVTMGFVGEGDDAEAMRFEETAFAWESKRVGPDFARSLIFRRRGNVVFYYEKATDNEVVRIAQGCLGGPPYGGNGGEPPEGGFPPLPPSGTGTTDVP